MTEAAAKPTSPNGNEATAEPEPWTVNIRDVAGKTLLPHPGVFQIVNPDNKCYNNLNVFSVISYSCDQYEWKFELDQYNKIHSPHLVTEVDMGTVSSRCQRLLFTHFNSHGTDDFQNAPAHFLSTIA